MTGLVRKATLLGVCGLLAASAAMANVPSPTNSTVPSYINIGGKVSLVGGPDPSIAYTVVVKDALGAVIAGSLVELNLQNCTDADLCTAVVAGETVDCVNKAVRGNTNATGQITFSILGAGFNPGNLVPPAIFAGAGLNCMRVFADGTQLNQATVIHNDPNGNKSGAGNNGTNGLDLAVFKTDLGAAGLGAPYRGRSDYSHDGTVNGLDLSGFKTVLGAAGLGTGSGGGCASGGAAAPYCVAAH